MKSSKTLLFVLEGSVWPYDIIFSFGMGKEEMIKRCKEKFENPFTKEDIELLNLSGRGFCLMLENNGVIVWLEKYPASPEWFGHLAHEIFHATHTILNKAGIRLSEDSDESFAYLIDWITSNVYSKLK